MALELYRRVLADLDGSLERLMLYNYGEPFLHPHIFDMIAEARQAEIFTRASAPTGWYFYAPIAPTTSSPAG